MTLKAGVDNALYHGMAFKEGRNPHRVLAMLFNADIKSFETAVDKESFKRPENRTGHILKAEQVALIDEFLCACRHARNNIAVTVKILGCAVDNNIRTEIEGTLEVRCCKRVVNNNLCIGAILMRDLGDCGNVNELEVRVRGRFKIESLCVGTNRSANGIEILEINKGDFNTVAGQSMGKEGESAAVKRVIRKQMVSRMEHGPHNGCYRTHAACHCHARFGMFKSSKLFADFCRVGIAETGVEEASTSRSKSLLTSAVDA